jgi:hypothetical protein
LERRLLNLSENRPIGSITFWFDKNKPRSEFGKTAALQRWRASKKARGESIKPIKGNPKSPKDKHRQEWHSVHHIDLDRSNGDANNLFVCETQEQHENIELQIRQMGSEMIKAGLVGFDLLHKKYFIDFEPIVERIKAWRDSVRPNPFKQVV